MSRIVIQPHYGKTLGLVLAGMLMINASIFVLALSFGKFVTLGVELPNKPLAGLVSAVGIVFFGVATGYGIYALIRNRPLLILDDTGFTDHSTLSAAGFVSWENVICVRICDIRSQRFIWVSVRNPELLMEGRSRLVRTLIGANMKMGYPPVTIRTNAFRQNPEEVVAAMTAFLEAHRAGGHILDIRPHGLQPT